jgi:hypothetical protein
LRPSTAESHRRQSRLRAGSHLFMQDAMRTEAASAGFYESGWTVGGVGKKHPKIQIITVGELLDGKTIDAPPMQDVRTFKKAPRVKPKKDKQAKIFDGDE